MLMFKNTFLIFLICVSLLIVLVSVKAGHEDVFKRVNLEQSPNFDEQKMVMLGDDEPENSEKTDKPDEDETTGMFLLIDHNHKIIFKYF